MPFLLQKSAKTPFVKFVPFVGDDAMWEPVSHGDLVEELDG
jgi:hypothetical protein